MTSIPYGNQLSLRYPLRDKNSFLIVAIAIINRFNNHCRRVNQRIESNVRRCIPRIQVIDIIQKTIFAGIIGTQE